MIALKRVLLATALFGGVSLTPLGAGAQILTLEEIEAKAQRPRPELLERQAAVERAQAELGVVQSSSAPTLGGRVDAALAPGGRLIEVPLNPARPDDIYYVQGSRTLGESEAFLPVPRYGVMLAGKLTLLDFGRTRLGVRAAESAISAERASLIQAKVELVQQAREAYLMWLEAHQTWQLAERDAEVAAARTVSVRELIAEGARPATDATLSAYDEQLALLRQTRAERAVEAALQALAAAVQNELPSRSVPDLDVLEAEPAPEPPASEARPPGNPPAPRAPQRTGSDPALIALERQQQAALSAARAADHGGIPVLDASAELGVQGQETQVFPVYRVGLSLSIPLWDGGRQASQAAVHRAEAHGIEARLRAVEKGIRAREEAARSRYRAASAELRLSLMLLATAELMLSEAEEHYRAGSDTLERVLGAQRSLVQARREVLTTQLEAARARLELTPVKVEGP